MTTEFEDFPGYQTRSREFKIRETWGRMGGLAHTYYGIAETSFNDYLLEKSKPPIPLKENEDPESHFAQDRRIWEAAIKTIVFSGMCVEAAAFDFAAIHLSDSYARQYLDKLDPVAKWVIVLPLVCGHSLKLDGPAINFLRTLIRCRNELVHQKSMPHPAEISLDAFDALIKRENKMEENVPLCFKAVVLLSLELNTVLGTLAGVLPKFEKDDRDMPSHDSMPLIKAAIEDCRNIHAKNHIR